MMLGGVKGELRGPYMAFWARLPESGEVKIPGEQEEEEDCV